MGLKDRIKVKTAKKFVDVMNSEQMKKARNKMHEEIRFKLGERGYLPEEIEEILFVISNGEAGRDTRTR